MQQRDQLFALFNVECSHSFGAVELVCGECQVIYIETLYIDRGLPDGLYRIGMEKDMMLFAYLPYLFDREDGTGLIVRPHDGDKRCFVGNIIPDALCIDKTFAVDGQVGNPASHTLDELCRSDH